MNIISSDIIFLITKELNYHDHVSLMLCTKRLFGLLNSDRYLQPISKRERLSITDVRSGLQYLQHHPVYNYNDTTIISQPTYFRQYCGDLAVDIFDRLWIRKNYRRTIKTQKRVVCAYPYNIPDWPGRYDGYLVLTHKGTIIHYSWRGRTIHCKRVALDLRVEGDYFIYRTKLGYRVGNLTSDVSMNDFLATLSLSVFLDHQGNLWKNKEIIACDVKKYIENNVIYYLTHNGNLCVEYPRSTSIFQRNVKDCFFYGGCIYTVTSDNQIHEFLHTQKLKTRTLPRSAKRIEVGVYHKVLIEYE